MISTNITGKKAAKKGLKRETVAMPLKSDSIIFSEKANKIPSKILPPMLLSLIDPKTKVAARIINRTDTIGLKILSQYSSKRILNLYSE